MCGPSWAPRLARAWALVDFYIGCKGVYTPNVEVASNVGVTSTRACTHSSSPSPSRTATLRPQPLAPCLPPSLAPPCPLHPMLIPCTYAHPPHPQDSLSPTASFSVRRGASLFSSTGLAFASRNPRRWEAYCSRRGTPPPPSTRASASLPRCCSSPIVYSSWESSRQARECERACAGASMSTG